MIVGEDESCPSLLSIGSLDPMLLSLYDSRKHDHSQSTSPDLQ